MPKSTRGERIAASRRLNEAFKRKTAGTKAPARASYMGTLPSAGPTPARLHLASCARKLAPVSRVPYHSPTKIVNALKGAGVSDPGELR
jgi:hypothetical protein